MTREEAAILLKAELATMTFTEETKDRIQALYMAIKALEELPKRRKEVKRWKRKALHAEPVKHGKWIEEKDGWYGGQGCRCSSCGYGYSYKAYHEPYEFDFCPNCGCAMTKEKEK